MTSRNEIIPDASRKTEGTAMRFPLSRKAGTVILVLAGMSTGAILGTLANDWATDETYDDRINACVAALEAEGAGPRAACESLNSSEEKQEAAYRWAVQQGVMK
jgi:hypothetical protein